MGVGIKSAARCRDAPPPTCTLTTDSPPAAPVSAVDLLFVPPAEGAVERPGTLAASAWVDRQTAGSNLPATPYPPPALPSAFGPRPAAHRLRFNQASRPGEGGEATVGARFGGGGLLAGGGGSLRQTTRHRLPSLPNPASPHHPSIAHSACCQLTALLHVRAAPTGRAGSTPHVLRATAATIFFLGGGSRASTFSTPSPPPYHPTA